MGYDGVAPVYYLGVVPALIEHTHIHTQVICQVNGAVHSAFVRADNH